MRAHRVKEGWRVDLEDKQEKDPSTELRKNFTVDEGRKNIILSKNEVQTYEKYLLYELTEHLKIGVVFSVGYEKETIYETEAESL